MSLLLALSILFNFFIGILISKNANQSIRMKILIFGITLNLCLLGFFKYTLFMLDLITDLSKLFSQSFSIWRPEILLPVGISFYTFHNISYLIELNKKNILVSKNLITFSVYDIFFPLLLAGPIERPNSLLPQLEANRFVTKDSIYKGFSIFAWGIFLKTAIADPLAKFVDSALSQNGELPGGLLWIVAPAFAFQVYADFSGYSNCARGLAYAMGFKLMNNFHRPFFSSNPVLFWQRWHISLSSWLRDYVYIPLGGNRVGLFRQNVNILIVWVLGGLWHGATYGYLVWGIYLGICIIIYNILKTFILISIPRSLEIPFKFVGILITFFSFAFGLLLFRINNSNELLLYLDNILSFSNESLHWTFVLLYFVPILAFDAWQEKLKTTETDWQLKEVPYLFWFSFVILFIIFSLVSPFAKQEFFYFQF
jgi:D-alanyl-lipoteichoic acid acyltransferase DltB (MBOAT superfamily)